MPAPRPLTRAEVAAIARRAVMEQMRALGLEVGDLRRCTGDVESVLLERKLARRGEDGRLRP